MYPLLGFYFRFSLMRKGKKEGEGKEGKGKEFSMAIFRLPPHPLISLKQTAKNQDIFHLQRRLVWIRFDGRVVIRFPVFFLDLPHALYIHIPSTLTKRSKRRKREMENGNRNSAY